ncbi:MAG: CHAD domain-containing protein [Pseudohongiellaceae bacterium]|jgi:CHAD domain-containing protein
MAWRGYTGLLRTALSDLPPVIDQSIEPSWPLEVAAQVLALRQLRALGKCHELALVGERVAGVHQLRMACGRLRVLLTRVAGVWPRKQLKPLRKSVAKLSKALGQARDCDVEISRLCERISRVHDAEERAVRWLWNRAVGARNREHQAVVSALDNFAAEGWFDRLADFFSTTPVDLVSWTGSISAEGAEYPTVGQALPGLIEAEVESVWQLTWVLSEPAGHDGYHDLRLAGKGLRYLLEAFGTCLKQKPRKLTKPLRRCQKVLGELHDGELQVIQLIDLLSDHGKGLKRIMLDAVKTEGETDELGDLAHQAARVCHDLPAEGLAIYLAALADRRAVLRNELVIIWEVLEETGYRERLKHAAELSS